MKTKANKYCNKREQTLKEHECKILDLEHNLKLALLKIQCLQIQLDKNSVPSNTNTASFTKGEIPW